MEQSLFYWRWLLVVMDGFEGGMELCFAFVFCFYCV